MCTVLFSALFSALRMKLGMGMDMDMGMGMGTGSIEYIGSKIDHEYQWGNCASSARAASCDTCLQSWSKRPSFGGKKGVGFWAFFSPFWVGHWYCFYQAGEGLKTWPRALSTCAPDAYLILFYLGFLFHRRGSKSRQSWYFHQIRDGPLFGVVAPDGPGYPDISIL